MVAVGTGDVVGNGEVVGMLEDDDLPDLLLGVPLLLEVTLLLEVPLLLLVLFILPLFPPVEEDHAEVGVAVGFGFAEWMLPTHSDDHSEEATGGEAVLPPHEASSTFITFTISSTAFAS